jgi:hypothetical protein
MPSRLFRVILAAAALATLADAALVFSAQATTITTTLGAPGQITPQFLTGTSGQGMCNQNLDPLAVCVYGTESFSGFTQAQATNGFTSTFSTGANNFPTGDSISGTYSGQIAYTTTNQYGGVPGSAGYPTASGVSTYTVKYASQGIPGINYLGVWISALDQYNDFALLMSDGTSYDFSAATIKTFIDASPLKSQYYGNPTPGQLGADSSEPFAYLNFYVTGSYFTQMKFVNTGSTGFESSNHAAGYFSPLTMTGSSLTTYSVAVPEPSAVLLLGVPIVAALIGRRRV